MDISTSIYNNQQVGDGDLGINLAGFANNVLSNIDSYPFGQPEVALHKLALSLQEVLGGNRTLIINTSLLPPIYLSLR